jgi:hypothetical protein
MWHTDGNEILELKTAKIGRFTYHYTNEQWLTMHQHPLKILHLIHSNILTAGSSTYFVPPRGVTFAR